MCAERADKSSSLNASSGHPSRERYFSSAVKPSEIAEFLDSIHSLESADEKAGVSSYIAKNSAAIEKFIGDKRKQGCKDLADYYEKLVKAQRHAPLGMAGELSPAALKSFHCEKAAVSFTINASHGWMKWVGYVTMVVMIIMVLYLGWKARELLHYMAEARAQSIDSAVLDSADN